MKDIFDDIIDELKYEADFSYADFDAYKYEYFCAEPDELPDDDFRYGLHRAIEIIEKYKLKFIKEE